MNNDIFVSDNEKYLTKDDYVVDITTGEKLSLEQVIEIEEKELEKHYESTQNKLIEAGTVSTYKLVKYKGKKYDCYTIKVGYDFGKVFRVSVRELMTNGNLSKNAKLCIATLEPFISFPTNSVVINYKTPTLEQIMKIVELKKSALYDTLKELEEKEVIKRVKRNGQTIIYFNPFLYCCGRFVITETYELFKGSKYSI